MANWSMIEDAIGAIRAYPERHDQQWYFAEKDSGSFPQQNGMVTEERVPACGTTACLAGWILLRNLPLGTEFHWPSSCARNPGDWAAELAGLNESQRYLLFHGSTDDIEKVAQTVKFLQAREAEDNGS